MEAHLDEVRGADLLEQKPRGVLEDLFRCHGDALRVDDGGASRVSYARAGPGGIGPVGG